MSWRPPTKSENEGPAFSLSEKAVGLMRGLSSGESVAGGLGAAVANVRNVGTVVNGALRALSNVEHWAHTYLGVVDIFSKAGKVGTGKIILEEEV